MSHPGTIEQSITALHGEDGRRWLDDLPRRLTDYERRWDLRVMAPFDNLSFKYVVPATRLDGRTCVLKLCYGGPEVDAEMAALRLADGDGIICLMEEDPTGTPCY